MPNTLQRLLHKIREINHQYHVPRIEMSTGVKLSLLSLRIYLLFLVCLMVYKFIRLFRISRGAYHILGVSCESE